MRKVDLPKCPDWLRDAATENEDVAWWNDQEETWVVWCGGEWRDGVWRGGSSGIRSPWFVVAHKDGEISIGCKRKTRADWDAWFAGAEEFSTPRSDPKFRLIHAHYLAVCAWLDAQVETPTEKPKKRRAKKEAR